MQTFFQALVNGILIGGIYAVVATGLTLIFGVMNIVNFAQGEFLMLAMFMTFVLASYSGVDSFLLLLPVAIVFFAFGVLIKRMFIERVLDRGHEAPYSHYPSVFPYFSRILPWSFSVRIFTP